MSPVHATLTLNFWDEEAEEEVPVQVDYLMDRTLDFRDYDVDEDVVLEEMGYEPTPAVGLVKAFGRYGKDFFKRLKKVRPRTVFSAEETARLISDVLFERFYEGFADHDWDAHEAHYAILGQDEYARQLALLLKDNLAGKPMKPADLSAELIAQTLEPYVVEPDQMEVEVRHHDYRDINDPNVMSWNNILDARYCLVIYDVEVVCWARTLEFRMFDPVGFNGDVTDWGEDWGIEELKVPDEVSQVLNELGLDEPELEDPEPPDYPMKATAKDPHPWYGVLYEINPAGWKPDAPNEYTVVPYATLDYAEEAMELSKAIIEHSGEEPIEAMWLVREKTSEERERDEFEAKQQTLFDIDKLTEEWTKDWVMLEEDALNLEDEE